MNMADQQLRDQSGAAVMKMAFGLAKDQGTAVVDLIKSSALPQISDPALGTNVNMLA
ncbi:hypothetical protein MASR2M78_12840 [Treponema sp.]